MSCELSESFDAIEIEWNVYAMVLWAELGSNSHKLNT